MPRPEHVITLCRPTRESAQPPQFATFKVPLRFNKLDIRDYLLHAYNVRSVAVRSAVMRRPIRRNEVTMRMQRPPPIKYMTVEMDKPFVWPKEPTAEERKLWHYDGFEKRVEQQKKHEEQMELYQKHSKLPDPTETKRTRHRTMLAQQAKDLLSGKTKWENKRELDPRWTK